MVNAQPDEDVVDGEEAEEATTVESEGDQTEPTTTVADSVEEEKVSVINKELYNRLDLLCMFRCAKYTPPKLFANLVKQIVTYQYFACVCAHN